MDKEAAEKFLEWVDRKIQESHCFKKHIVRFYVTGEELLPACMVLERHVKKEVDDARERV